MVHLSRGGWRGGEKAGALGPLAPVKLPTFPLCDAPFVSVPQEDCLLTHPHMPFVAIPVVVFTGEEESSHFESD